MAAIAPFRHLIVYPPMMREMERNWQLGLAGWAAHEPPGQRTQA